jgi:hypothetical protein
MSLNFQELSKKFVPSPNYRVNVPWDYLESNLLRWQDPKDGVAILNLEPEFQRLHVWTPLQQTKFIEYILQGGMSGREIYFNCTGWMKDFRGPFVIVDGKQRLHAVREFLTNKVPIFGGNYCKDIQGRLPFGAQFIFCVNDLNTHAEVIRWYLEMNTGGTPHTAEEIAKAELILEKCFQ